MAKKKNSIFKKYFSVEWILRFGIFATFLGHGVYALQGYEKWIPYFLVVGISESMANTLLPFVGLIDIAIAILVLFYPIKIVIALAAFLGFWTALLRPLAGELMREFVARGANWAAPLALLVLRGIPKKLNEWFKP